MKIFLVMNDERYANAEIDDAEMAYVCGDDMLKQAQFISQQLVAYIDAMLYLKKENKIA